MRSSSAPHPWGRVDVVASPGASVGSQAQLQAESLAVRWFSRSSWDLNQKCSRCCARRGKTATDAAVLCVPWAGSHCGLHREVSS